jgi:pyruvate kinase
MICRRDLALEIPAEKVFVAQRWMIEKANFHAKPVMISQQVFPSMTKNARPVRAEASDVCNAVLSGVDCVVLEEETISGDYPVNAVALLARTCLESESTVDHKKEFNDIKLQCPAPEGSAESVALAAVAAVHELAVEVILVHTDSGKLARLIEKFRPPVPVVVCSKQGRTINAMHAQSGVIGI